MTTPERSRIMRAVRSKGTGAELAVRRLLRAMGATGYRLHRADLPGAPDVAFVGRRKAIFVNGCFWHGHDCRRGARAPKTNRAYWADKIARNVRRDGENIRALEGLGWDVCVIWECELRDPDAVCRRLTAFLKPAAV
jgi:DNA mismatch endonuclease (patch repair protein)